MPGGSRSGLVVLPDRPSVTLRTDTRTSTPHRRHRQPEENPSPSGRCRTAHQRRSIRPAGGPTPLDTASPRGRRASPQAPGRPQRTPGAGSHRRTQYPLCHPMRLGCLTKSSLRSLQAGCSRAHPVHGLTTTHAREGSSAGYRLGAQYPTPPRLRPSLTPTDPHPIADPTYQRIKRRPVLYGLLDEYERAV